MSKFIILEDKEEFNFRDYIINTEFVTDVPDDGCNLIVLRPTDEFDISLIDNWAVDYFNVRYANVEDIKTIVELDTNLTVDYPSDIPVDEIEVFSILLPVFNELTDYTDKFVQPFSTWTWDKNLGHWKPPIDKPNLDISIRSQWFEDWLNWKISFGSVGITRNRRAYQLWLAAEVDGSSMFLDACSTRNYMIKPFENITHGTREFEKMVKQYNDLVAENSDIPGRYMSIMNHIIVIDLSPIGIVTYSECHNDAIELFNKAYSLHPQAVSRTPQELFRLIIEWAYSHTDMGNEELTAVTCDNILKAVQMPKEIRDGLIAMQPQQVGKFLEGAADALFEDDEDPESPAGFDRWVNTLYYHYPHLEAGQETHIDTLPASYPL